MSKLQKSPELKSLVEEISTIIEYKAHTSEILYRLFDGDDVEELFYNHPELITRSEVSNFTDSFLKDKGYKAMESEGGHEGGGEYCYGVIRLGDKYYKAGWAYYSYNGCEYDYIEDTIKEVTPVEKTVIVYE